ncbi:RHS repeat-associated core domain-containing protein [Streptomyces viridochromogenes]|uniref:RHS repeat-associated core domain-containing protein n=1 Tax=Streptomyces viridochromogenes TaxID=1938 RepID=UPI00099D72D0
MWQTDKTDTNKLAAWTFDTLAKGQPDTSVRYDGGLAGKAYTQKVTAYDNLYQATGSQLLLPDTDPLVTAGVPKTLSFTTGYNLDGTVSQSGAPAAAGLAAETVSYTYNALGQQLTSKGNTGYLQAAAFSPQGDLRQLTLGMDGTTSAKKAYLTWIYENGTRRLTRAQTTDDVHSYPIQDLNFTQDDAGNVTSIFDITTLGGTAKADSQCFAYDGHRRLTEAWTPKTADCSASGRVMSNIDGVAPYWTSFTYNGAGQRTTETQHKPSGDELTTLAYNEATDNRQHTLDKTTGARSGSYIYDNSGNTISRPGPSAEQTLAWNTEGKLSKLVESTKETNYLYDAGGELLIRRAKGDGDTVLYVGGTEVRLTVKGTTKTLSGTRYYTANGQTIAVRTAVSGTSGTKLSFLAADHHGTSSVALDASTYAVTKRYSTPFGESRGTKATNWPDDKAFLGKPADGSTGLTHVGAREYDPAIGQFISVDPLLEVDRHQTLNGYSYGAQSPITESDPTGMGLACGGEFPACPTHPDGTPGNGQPIETVDNDNGTAGTASTSSSGNTNSGDDAGCWPIYTCGAQEGPADNVNNMGNGGPDIPSFWDNLAASFSQGPLAALLSGDPDEAWDRLNPTCPNPAVCEPATGTVDVGFGPSLLARTATKATSKQLAAQVEVLFLKKIAGKGRAALAGSLELEGRSPMLLLATSGTHQQTGLVPIVGGKGNPARYKATATGNSPRTNDTEYKMLTYIANQLGEPSSIKGSLTLHSSQQACTSCTPVIGQFSQEFPNIRINYTSGRS